MDSLKKIKFLVLKSKALQTFIDTILTVLIGIFSGTFVTEITVEGKISWVKWPETSSFYFLIALMVIFTLYKKMLIGSEDQIHLFMDKEYCLAYAKSQLLPEAALKAKEKIRNGQGGEFLDAMKEIEKVLK